MALVGMVVGGISWMGQAGATFGLSAGLSATLTGTTMNQYLPTAATATRITATSCRVSWTPDAGAPAQVRYDVTDGAGSTLLTDRPGVTDVVTVPATAVTPTVKARIRSWISPGQTVVTAPCLGWPDAPGSLQVSPGDRRLDVDWAAPSGNGGTVASYTADLSPGGGSCTVAAPTTACSFTGLTNGVTYTVSVVATSEVGGSPAATATGTPTDHLPSAPTAVSAVPSHGQAAVGWSAPADDGGSAVTGYTVTATPDDAGLATRSCSAAASPCTVTGLVDGAGYTVVVAAQNAHGTGTGSAGVTAIPYPSTVMTGARLALWLDGAAAQTQFGDTGCGTPASTGQPLGCWADRSGHGHDAVQPGATARPTLATVDGRTVPGFDGGDALGVSGLPAGTDPSSSFVVARSQDPAPAGIRTVLGWGTVGAGGTRTLTHVAGGTGMAVEADSLGALPAGDWSGPGWRGLDDGWTAAAGGTVQAWSAGTGQPAVDTTGYGFGTGSGSGAIGDGPGGGSGWSGPVAEVIVFADPLTPAERRTVQEYLARKWGLPLAPAAPASVSAGAGGAGSVDVTWSAPDWDGGAAVTGYTATAAPGGASCTTAGTGCTISGLAAGQSYTVTVVATNARGAGPASEAPPVAL